MYASYDVLFYLAEQKNYVYEQTLLKAIKLSELLFFYKPKLVTKMLRRVLENLQII